MTPGTFPSATQEPPCPTLHLTLRVQPLTRAKSKSACLQCLQKCTAGPEWGRVTGSP